MTTARDPALQGAHVVGARSAQVGSHVAVSIAVLDDV